MNKEDIKQLLQRPIVLGMAVIATLITGLILAYIILSALIGNLP